MDSKRTHRARRLYLAAFAVLTLLTWSPLGYGQYGPAARLLGMPRWATLALLAGVGLFLLEWVFLFRTRLSLDDDQLAAALERLRADGAAPETIRKAVNA